MSDARAGSIVALDAAYGEAASVAAAAIARAWEDETPESVRLYRAPPAAPYEPGAFYKRELPLLEPLIRGIAAPISAILVDGYVWIDAQGRPGLGARLYAAIDRRAPVIGVAKTRLKTDDVSISILRGKATRPLFVTAAGMAPEEAAAHVARMGGPYRLPALLTAADRAARDALVET